MTLSTTIENATMQTSSSMGSFKVSNTAINHGPYKHLLDGENTCSPVPGPRFVVSRCVCPSLFTELKHLAPLDSPEYLAHQAVSPC